MESTKEQGRRDWAKDWMTRWLGSAWGLMLTGGAIGALGAVLAKLARQPNRGFCSTGFYGDLILAFFPSQTDNACWCSFSRETGVDGLVLEGAIRRGDYIRPEFLGFVLGAFGAALLFREFRVRRGSGTLIHFALGFCGMMGMLVFWGCPVRALLRLGGGDLSAVVGLAGLLVGVALGIVCLRYGFELGRERDTHLALGLVVPLGVVVLLAWSALGRSLLPLPRAPYTVALLAGLLIGFLAQRSRFCIMSSFRNTILMRSLKPLATVTSVIVASLSVNLAMGQVRWGFAGQPIAHSNHLWNFLGMVLGGLAFTLAGACPTRQLFLSGEGSVDASAFVLGMLAASGLAPRLGLVTQPDIVVAGTVFVGGPNARGMVAVAVSLAACLAIGLRKRH